MSLPLRLLVAASELAPRTASNFPVPLLLVRQTDLDHRKPGNGDRHRLAGLRHCPPHDGTEGSCLPAWAHWLGPVRAAVPPHPCQRLDRRSARPALDRPGCGGARARMRRSARVACLDAHHHAALPVHRGRVARRRPGLRRPRTWCARAQSRPARNPSARNRAVIDRVAERRDPGARTGRVPVRLCAIRAIRG